MAVPHPIQSRLKTSLRRIENYTRGSEKSYLKNLVGVCELVRGELEKDSPYLPELLEEAQAVLESGVSHAPFKFMPSWAHEKDKYPLIEDPPEQKPVELTDSQIRMLTLAFPDRFTMSADELVDEVKEMNSSPWTKKTQRHPKSSPLARFRPKLPPLTYDSPNAMCVVDACCEIQSTRTATPHGLNISRNGSCLALNVATGSDNRAPGLYYRFLQAESCYHFFQPGLARVASHIALDDDRRLLFVGDKHRIKSYAWADPESDDYVFIPNLHPTHTLNSQHARGPMVALPNGTVIRAGEGEASVWNIDALKTHGKTGRNIVGKQDNRIYEHARRHDKSQIEPSTGSSRSSCIQFGNPSLSVTGWEPLVQAPSTMLSYSGKSDCLTLDLEHGGSIAARYLGHGGTISDISLSADAPQKFLTGCNDGYARLFDLRMPFPVLTFDAGQRQEVCAAVALAHPGGIPIAFTGAKKSEQIKLWDLRARTIVYELATGNNQVESLVWSSYGSCLYAATSCQYDERWEYHSIDRQGKRKRSNEDENEYSEDPLNYTFVWPKEAYHHENYFGYAFHAGEHQMYCYNFMRDPGPLRFRGMGALVGSSWGW
ncbi:ribosomal L44 domain protein [Ceratobasidium sp. AG-Ba]|nr:ribosomal L44 domain protein [Ceratobasidium sp. AG-Ba]